MRKNSKPFIKIATSLVTLISILSCAPARWAEVDGRNSASGNNGSGQVEPIMAESFDQNDAANKVDILIINDNSASMDEEQRKMSLRFSSFVSELGLIDYRIAMTTTDIDSSRWGQYGRIMTWADSTDRVLTPVTVDAKTKFKKTIQRSETIGCMSVDDGFYCPSSTEQPLRAIELAIEQRATANKDLFRAGVDFVAVILSDEDEMSTGPANATKAQSVLDTFTRAFQSSKRFAVHGIVVKPGDSACRTTQQKQGAGAKSSYATHVAALATLTNGTLSSICDTDYSASLSAISAQVRKLVSSFELQHTPKAGTIKVKLTPVPAEPLTWSVEGKNLIFSKPPASGTRIDVIYET